MPELKQGRQVRGGISAKDVMHVNLRVTHERGEGKPVDSKEGGADEGGPAQ
jgi:hypothetical protein